MTNENTQESNAREESSRSAYDLPKNRKNVDNLYKEVKDRTRSLSSDGGASRDKDEIERAMETFKENGMEVILKDRTQLEQTIYKLGMKLGLVTPEKVALWDQGKLRKIAGIYENLYKRTISDLDKADRKIYDIRLTIGKIYSLDKGLESVIDDEQKNLARLQKERNELIKEIGEDTNVEKRIEAVDAQIVATQSYLRKQEKRSQENILDEKRMQKSLALAVNEFKLIEHNASIAKIRWYKLDECIEPVQNIANMMEGKKKDLKMQPMIKRVGERLTNLTNTINEGYSKFLAIALRDIDLGFKKAPSPQYDNGDLEDVERDLEASMRKEMDAMKNRRNKHFGM